MGLALDESTESDTTEEKDGFTFCINKELLEQVQGVKVDLSYMGFVLEPAVPLAGGGESGCSGCGSSGSSGGCGH